MLVYKEFIELTIYLHVTIAKSKSHKLGKAVLCEKGSLPKQNRGTIIYTLPFTIYKKFNNICSLSYGKFYMCYKWAFSLRNAKGKLFLS